MLTFFTAISSILVTWLFWWPIFIGVGLLAGRALGLRLTPLNQANRWFAAFWSGWAATIILLTFWHFALPVNRLAAGVVIGFGLCGLFLNRKQLSLSILSLFRGWSGREWLIVLWLVALTLWAADHALDGPAQYDSGLYHLQSIRWIMSHPIVPGLGNLHGRLAFNQTYFLYAALLGAGPWIGRVGHVANGLLLLPLLAQLSLMAFGQGRSQRNVNVNDSEFNKTDYDYDYDYEHEHENYKEQIPNPKSQIPNNINPHSAFRIPHSAFPVSRLLALLLLVPAIEQTLQVNISSPSPDMPVFILGIVLMLGLLPLLTQPGLSEPETRARVVRLALLGFVAPTVKLNLLVLGLLVPFEALLIWWFRHRRARQFRLAFTELRRLTLKLALLFTLPILPWLGRDAVLSGWLGFPTPWLPLPVPWRMPRADVVDFFNGVRYFARNPLNMYAVNYEPLGFNWVMTRVLGNRFSVLLPLAFLAIVLVLAWVQEHRRFCPRNRAALWLFFLPAALSVVYWFVSAPDPRFCGAGLWLISAGPLAFMLARLPEVVAGHSGGRHSKNTRWLPAGLTLALIAAQIMLVAPYFRVFGPGPDHGFRVVSQASMRVLNTASGLSLYVPINSDQCADAPLPATPYPRPDLRLRRPGELASGFLVNPGAPGEVHGKQLLADSRNFMAQQRH